MYGNDESEYERTMKSLLCPFRLTALEAADATPVTYDKYSFFADILVIRGRNLKMLIAPLASLFLWGLGWQLFFFFGSKSESAQEYLVSIETLVEPLITPLAFLLVFRLGRAAVRYWEVSVFNAMGVSLI
jgi:hypothetical protein